MTDTYKLMARTVNTTEIARFDLAEGEDLNDRVASEIQKAADAGGLDKMATRVGLPAIGVSQLGEGENLAGGENTVNIALYAPDGTPLADRRFRTQTVNNGMTALIAIEDDVESETPIGVFTDAGVADAVGLFWKNGHLNLKS